MKLATCVCEHGVTFSSGRSEADEMCCDGISQVTAAKGDCPGRSCHAGDRALLEETWILQTLPQPAEGLGAPSSLQQCGKPRGWAGQAAEDGSEGARCILLCFPGSLSWSRGL